MDIYRFFHPHHNPRLHSTPIRQQEVSELEQAASELRKALDRAQQRSSRKPSPPILPEHFTDIIKAMRFVEASLQTLCDAHAGDSKAVLKELINERVEFKGWEGWTNLLGEHLASVNNAAVLKKTSSNSAIRPEVNHIERFTNSVLEKTP